MQKRLLLGVSLCLILLSGCDEKTTEEVKEVSNNTIDKVAEVTQQSSEKANEIMKKVQEEAKPMVEELSDKSQQMVSQMAGDAIEMTQSIQDKLSQIKMPKPDGKTLYTVCASCHGSNGKVKALNVSQPINGWEKERIFNALKGYQDGTYGGKMKTVMQGQVKNLNDEQLLALAEYIASF